MSTSNNNRFEGWAANTDLPNFLNSFTLSTPCDNYQLLPPSLEGGYTIEQLRNLISNPTTFPNDLDSICNALQDLLNKHDQLQV